MTPPGGDFALHLQRLPRTVGLRRIARELLVRQVGVVLDRAGRLHDVDPAGTFAESQLRSPGRRVEGACQIDIGRRSIQFAEVRALAHPDQIPPLQVGLLPMEEPPYARDLPPAPAPPTSAPPPTPSPPRT